MKIIRLNKTKMSDKGGPKTDEGKAVSKYNAIKHGLLSKEVLLEGDDAKAFVDFGNAICQELNPIGPFEEALVDRIISSYWRLRRAVYVEKHTMDWYGEDKETFVLVQET